MSDDLKLSVSRLAAALSLGLAACGPPSPSITSPSADTVQRTTPVVPSRPARVFIFAGLGDKCEPLGAPKIEIDEPATKGDVTFTPGQATTIATSLHGNCNGRQATGTGVYYTARPGSTGTDHFAVSASLPSGEHERRSFDVTIAE